MSKKDYKDTLERLQLALVQWQANAMERGDKVLVIFEGRDAAGKDGTIRRITRYLSVRHTLVHAPAKPSDRQQTEWFFQRFVPHLPAGGELVIFNRSWYNRGGVERVMGFSSPQEQEDFLREVPRFEHMLVSSGVRLIKFWLDVSKDEQAKRLGEREHEPLKALKLSPLDAYAQPKWREYSEARNEMLTRTHTEHAPWICVRSDDKKAMRLNVIRRLVHELATPQVRNDVEHADPAVLFDFELTALEDGRLAE